MIVILGFDFGWIVVVVERGEVIWGIVGIV